MSPRVRFLFTLMGVLLAGFPLLWLTLPSEHEATPETAPTTEANASKHTQAYLNLRFTGKPESIILRYGDDWHAEFPTGTTSPCETTIRLPAELAALDIEAEILWAQDSPENAVTLTVEPNGLPTKTDTQWTGPDGSMLHTIFSFSW